MAFDSAKSGKSAGLVEYSGVVRHHDARNCFAATLFELFNMKGYVSLVLASLGIALAGCSNHSQTAGIPNNNNLGLLDVSSGKPMIHTLADGRACTLTPTPLPDGNVSLATTIDETNGSRRTLTFQAPADGRAYTFAFDKSTVITVALRK
jgi:hypothetical protein